MWVLVIKSENTGVTVRYASHRKGLITETLDRWKTMKPDMDFHWRLWHHGWVESSPDAWKHIQHAGGNGEILVA